MGTVSSLFCLQPNNKKNVAMKMVNRTLDLLIMPLFK
jgi:hypothetical protein